MEPCVIALKEWTGKASATIIFDSTVDEFCPEGLLNKVKGKENTALVGFTKGGDVFGGFYNVAGTKQGGGLFHRNIFAFSFESRGRCATPQRFVVKDEWKKKVNVYFYKNSSYGFVWFGVDRVGHFYIGNERSNSFCQNMSHAFEGLQDTTLSGQNGTWDEGPYHYCTRLVAIQLE